MRKLLSVLYASFIRRRNRAFDAGRGVQHVPVPVFSVGNLSVGGSGKTPFVRTLVEVLLKKGYHPAIVSRGYGRKSKGLVVVRTESEILADVSQSGDELQMLAQSLDKCVIIASEIRYHGATRAIREYGVDCIVLDDGYQHRQLHRDADILLVDRNTLDHAQVVPAGVLREDFSGIERASLICYGPEVHANELSSYEKIPQLRIHTKLQSFSTLQGKLLSDFAIRVFLVCAIAEPTRFENTARSLGMDVCGTLFYRDHKNYQLDDIHAIIKSARELQCSMIVTTEKDAVKLQAFLSEFEANGCTIAVIAIETVFENASIVDELLTRVFMEHQQKERTDE